MKMIYTNESHFLVNNVKNLLEAQAINSFLKNEFAQGAMGEISAFDAWPEVWVFDDSEVERATAIAQSAQHNYDKKDWICQRCLEENDASFEICWQCQTENK